MKRSQGFTLIELMVVVAIVAILASLAITTYAKSISKAQLSEAFTIADGLKSGVLDFYHQTGECPSIGTPADGLASNAASYSGQYVASVDVTTSGGSCVITALMRNNSVTASLSGKQVEFTMNPAGDGTTQWSCSSNVAAEYLPQTCR